MTPALSGLHHVTAIAAGPQANVDFYVGLLGLRLVKKTVNFDDPNSYHLYYGDGVGSPGTLLTFFAWPGGRRGRPGLGQPAACALSVPVGSLDFWRARLAGAGVSTAEPETRLGETVLPFFDPDGMRLELVEAAPDGRAGWPGGPVPVEAAVRGLHSVTLPERSPERTAGLLAALGFHAVTADGAWTRYALGDGAAGASADVQTAPALAPAQAGVGSIHHVAWRTPDAAAQRAWLSRLSGLGHAVSPVMEREYFESIYFKEPGGILFEIATDAPGFLINETPETLGTTLQLPPQYEPLRARLERSLPPIVLPG